MPPLKSFPYEETRDFKLINSESICHHFFFQGRSFSSLITVISSPTYSCCRMKLQLTICHLRRSIMTLDFQSTFSYALCCKLPSICMSEGNDDTQNIASSNLFNPRAVVLAVTFLRALSNPIIRS